MMMVPILNSGSFSLATEMLLVCTLPYTFVPKNQNPELPFPSLKWFTCPSTKESDGPFPWKAPAGSASVASVVTERPSQLTMTRPDISKPLARFVDEGRALGTIHFQAPKLGLSAGAVLQHAYPKSGGSLLQRRALNLQNRVDPRSDLEVEQQHVRIQVC